LRYRHETERLLGEETLEAAWYVEVNVVTGTFMEAWVH